MAQDRAVFSARCNIYISRLCYDASFRLSVRLSVTEVHWRIRQHGRCVHDRRAASQKDFIYPYSETARFFNNLRKKIMEKSAFLQEKCLIIVRHRLSYLASFVK